MNLDLDERIAALERRLRTFHQELEEVKRVAAAAREERKPATTVVQSRPTPIAPPRPAPKPEPARPVAATKPAAPVKAAEPPRDGSKPREVDWADFLGARALAIAGGLVTVLGIVFFFALAVNRGWIGPELRVALGAAASTLVFVAGFELRRRYGETYSALAAVGAGLAGGYATLLFAAARYDLLPDLAALVLAGGIAAIGLAAALAWKAELVAGIGLVGAMLVPFSVVLTDEITAVGTGFVAIVLAAAGIVGVRRRWDWLLAWSAIASLPQAALLVIDADRADGAAIALTAAFVLIYGAIGIARHLARGRDGLDPLGASFVTGAAGFAAVSSLHLLSGTDRGIALLVLAGVYGVLATAFFRGRRDLSSLLSAAALILAAGAGGELLSGLGLATVWAAQGAILSWLAWRTRESRFQVGSIGYLALAAGHTLLYEAQPRDLFTAALHPASGAPALVALAGGLVALAAWSRHDERSSVLARVSLRQVDVRRAALIAAALAATGAASLAVLDLVQGAWTFSWGEVAVTAFWSMLALAALVIGLRRDVALVTLCGLAAYLTSIVKVTMSDPSLGEPQRWYAFLAVGAACLLGGFLYQLLEPRLEALHVAGVSLHGAGLALGARAIFELLPHDLRGVALLAIAAVYGVLAASIFPFRRQRDHTTLLWTVALGFAAAAAPYLLDGTLLVLAWSALAAALALLANRLREPRFLIGSAALVTVALAEALTKLAPPSELTSASPHPGDGVPALGLALSAALVLARLAPAAIEALRADVARSTGYRELAGSLRQLERATRVPGRWAIGLLGLYTASLGLLELSERIAAGGVDDAFQRGHTAVSACWALVALGLLYTGLTRRARALRLGGFALFGAALAKIFLYDLATLSSIARALSFLAVGALLLLAGFFYQRLTQQLGIRDEPRLSGS